PDLPGGAAGLGGGEAQGGGHAGAEGGGDAGGPPGHQREPEAHGPQGPEAVPHAGGVLRAVLDRVRPEPQRYVCLVRQEDSRAPGLLLSQAARGAQAGRAKGGGGGGVFDLKPPRNLRQECCLFLCITQPGYRPKDLQRFLNSSLPPALIQSMMVWSAESLLVEFASPEAHQRVLASLREKEKIMPFKVLLYAEMTGGG
ncbi:unnamed protein product, partial [Heterosigma akashiwo]